ncbi:MAG TPA: hypothetical protein VLJ39_08090, partial [Tepidisphaeraceae bacterium]|nr:hypothetical protein [Tepidisphaeraceae bacterium]
MNAAMIDKLVEAVLYEGYVLYPYRPSSVKNRHRWTFGGIYPRAYSEATAGSDPWFMQAQCLIAGSPNPSIQVAVRFLQPTNRTTLPEGHTWQEAIERRIDVGRVQVKDVVEGPLRHEFAFAAQRAVEPRADADGSILREQHAISGVVLIRAERESSDLFRLTVRVENYTEALATVAANREAASLDSFASTHFILGAKAGEFVSLTDPPAALARIAGECQNIGCWPVLVGAPGETDALLASPIILSDYPEVAAESPGD